MSELKLNFLNDQIDKISKDDLFCLEKGKFNNCLKKILKMIFLNEDDKCQFCFEKEEKIYVQVILIIIVTGFLGEKNRSDFSLLEMTDTHAELDKNKILHKPDEIRKKFFRKFLDYLFKVQNFQGMIEEFIFSQRDEDPNFFKACKGKSKKYQIALFRYLYQEMNRKDFNKEILKKYFKQDNYIEFIKKSKIKSANLTNEIYIKILQNEKLNLMYKEFLSDNQNYCINDVKSIANIIKDSLPKKEEFNLSELKDFLLKNFKKIKRCHKLPNFNLNKYARRYIEDLKMPERDFNISGAKKSKK